MCVPNCMTPLEITINSNLTEHACISGALEVNFLSTNNLGQATLDFQVHKANTFLTSIAD